MDSKAKFRLRKLLKELSTYRARHTELISVYIPARYDIVKVIQQLAQEQGTARNIKSTSTRKNVQDALEKMIRELRVFKQTPTHGLAIFSGNIASQEGKSNVRVWSIEPPVPLKTKIYRCDQTFFLDPLKDIGSSKEVYGLLVLDRREANIALLKGKTITPIKEITSMVPGKTRAGGQSAARFSRVREGMAKDFFKQVGEIVNKNFGELKGLKGIIVGGPGPTKENFVKDNYLANNIKNKIIAIIDIGYTSEAGLDELVNKSADILANEEVTKEKNAVNRFFNILNTKPNLVAYGKDDVETAISQGAVELLLISEDIDESKAESLIEKIEDFNGMWILISKETREGVQLAELGGLAAILRFAPQSQNS